MFMDTLVNLKSLQHLTHLGLEKTNISGNIVHLKSLQNLIAIGLTQVLLGIL